MAKIEGFLAHNFEEFGDGRAVAPISASVGKSNHALRIDEEDAGSIDIFRMDGEGHGIDAVEGADGTGIVPEVGPPDLFGIELLERFFGEPIFGIDCLAWI